MPLAALARAGLGGLAHAIESFDADKGFLLTPYAAWWVEQAIRQELR